MIDGLKINDRWEKDEDNNFTFYYLIDCIVFQKNNCNYAIPASARSFFITHTTFNASSRYFLNA
jgi:hypothetical protein